MGKTLTDKRQRGTSIVELLVVVAILTIVTGFAVPSISTIVRTYRISGDARSIAYTVNLARMRAAADFSHARTYIDLSSNTFHVEVWSKAGGCWQTDGDSNPCTQATSPVTLLADGDTFGSGTIAAGPTAETASIAQAPVCKTGVAGAAPGADIPNTACIEINSSGFTVDSSNTIVASDAIYITNGGSSYVAVAVPIAGQPRTYNYNGSAWALF
jgi:Tfp pilus assembly protein FimT